jgi:hypothetical protein
VYGRRIEYSQSGEREIRPISVLSLRTVQIRKSPTHYLQAKKPTVSREYIEPAAVSSKVLSSILFVQSTRLT